MPNNNIINSLDPADNTMNSTGLFNHTQLINSSIKSQEPIETQSKLKNDLTENTITVEMGKSTKIDLPVPNNLIGLIIGINLFIFFISYILFKGRGGETLNNINLKTGAFVFIPKDCEPGSNIRVLVISGLPEQIEMARNEIDEIVNMVR